MKKQIYRGRCSNCKFSFEMVSEKLNLSNEEYYCILCKGIIELHLSMPSVTKPNLKQAHQVLINDKFTKYVNFKKGE